MWVGTSRLIEGIINYFQIEVHVIGVELGYLAD